VEVDGVADVEPNAEGAVRQRHVGDQGIGFVPNATVPFRFIDPAQAAIDEHANRQVCPVVWFSFPMFGK
jgi:hypothetical protein